MLTLFIYQHKITEIFKITFRRRFIYLLDITFYLIFNLITIYDHNGGIIALSLILTIIYFIFIFTFPLVNMKLIK